MAPCWPCLGNCIHLIFTYVFANVLIKSMKFQDLVPSWFLNGENHWPEKLQWGRSVLLNDLKNSRCVVCLSFASCLMPCVKLFCVCIFILILLCLVTFCPCVVGFSLIVPPKFHLCIILTPVLCSVCVGSGCFPNYLLHVNVVGFTAYCFWM